ncbi:MAG: hypothetical protein ACXAD7_01650 [Candidatus Kariarchaeaceae archaeon]|jgi:hypothetical protein
MSNIEDLSLNDEYQKIKLKEITISIFAPLNTFIYLDMNQLPSNEISLCQKRILDEIDSRNESFQWGTESSLDFKISKGVFTPPGESNSLLAVKLPEVDVQEEVRDYPPGSLRFENPQVYIHLFGVGICAVEIKIRNDRGLEVSEIDAISEKLNELFKQYFEDPCYLIAKEYEKAIKKAEIKFYKFDFLPSITEVDKSSNIIPWTHRVYTIHDSTNDASLFDLENPGEPFSHLVTPSRKFDVEDFSIYDNHYIYFGWGHSIIITKPDDGSFSYTDRPASEYIRMVQIAQASWQGLNLLTQILDHAFPTFTRDFRNLSTTELKKLILDIRYFNIAIEILIDRFEGLNITYDTEKRILYEELHTRWLTKQMIERTKDRLRITQDILDDLHERVESSSSARLNNIVLFFTILTLFEIFDLLINVSGVNISPVMKFIIIIGGTGIISLLMVIYMKSVGRD